MNSRFSSKRGHLLVLRQTDRWSSSLIRSANEFPIDVRVFDLSPNFVEQIGLFPNGVLVIELTIQLIDQPELLQSIWRQTRRHGIPVIAAGDFTTCEAHVELIQAGFAEAFSSTADSDRILNLALNYLGKRRFQPESIESQIKRDLPWGKPTGLSGQDPIR